MLKLRCPCYHPRGNLLPNPFIAGPQSRSSAFVHLQIIGSAATNSAFSTTGTRNFNQKSQGRHLVSVTKALSTLLAAVAPTPSTMVKAIRVYEFGGPEVLKWEDVELGDPKEGEVRVKNKAIGLNFIDVYFRKGVYKAPVIPFTPGMEAAGVVTAVGPGVADRKVGETVAYAGNPMGA